MRQVKEKVRTLVIAAHGLSQEHVWSWCLRFAGQTMSRMVKGRDGVTAFASGREKVFHMDVTSQTIL